MASIVTVPRIAIEAPFYGSIPTRFLPEHVSLGTGIFDQGSATLEGFDPSPVMDVRRMAGEWRIVVGNVTYRYELDSREAERYAAGAMDHLTLSDRLSAWKVPLIQKTFAQSTVGALLSALVSAVSGLSGISCDVRTNDTTPLSDVCDNGIYEVANGTYLQSIQEICEWMGWAVYANPETGRFSVIAPCYTEPIGSVPIYEGYPFLRSAQFSIAYDEIHSDVIVANSHTGIGKIAGISGSPADTANFILAGKINPYLATVWQANDKHLQSMASELLKLDRQAGQGITVTIGGVLSSVLWRQFRWADVNGQQGLYKAIKSTVEITSSDVSTTIEGMIV